MIHTHIHIHTHTYTHNGILLIKKERMSFVESWMDLEIVILSEVRQAERYHLYVESKK